MTKQDFITTYQNKMNLSSKKEAEVLINGFFSTLEEILIKGEDLSILGFGKFETVIQSERVCRNPKTGDKMTVPAKKVVKFRVGKNLAEKIAK
ncbi:MAG: HU family DNA-binding protein [Cetobacterium sp.]